MSRQVVPAERPAKPGYWLTGYQRGWLGHDVVAGLTVTAILIPEGMAYAQLAGVDPNAAFYAAPVALFLPVRPDRYTRTSSQDTRQPPRSGSCRAS